MGEFVDSTSFIDTYITDNVDTHHCVLCGLEKSGSIDLICHSILGKCDLPNTTPLTIASCKFIDISPLFYYKQEEAAKLLGMSKPKLVRRYRAATNKYWPRTRLKSLDKNINDLLLIKNSSNSEHIDSFIFNLVNQKLSLFKPVWICKD